MKKYTIAEIASMCGTSPSTVSRVMNNPGIVEESLRTRIQSTMAKLQYRPNPFAARLGSKGGWGVALFVFDILNPFFAQIVRRIGRLALEERMPLTVCDTENNPDKERLYLDYVLENRIAGIIFTEGILAETINRAREQTAVVAIDRACENDRIAEISSDNYSGARRATEHLLQLNHTRIGFISGQSGWASSEARFRGYRDAITARGLEVDPTLVYHGNLRYESGIAALEYFLTLPAWPTAIFCANDQMAYGVHSKATSLNIAIPDDISLVGFDDTPFSSLSSGELTTVTQNIDELSRGAFEILHNRMRGNDGQTVKKSIIVPTRLKIGSTCKKLERRGLNVEVYR